MVEKLCNSTTQTQRTHFVEKAESYKNKGEGILKSKPNTVC